MRTSQLSRGSRRFHGEINRRGIAMIVFIKANSATTGHENLRSWPTKSPRNNAPFNELRTRLHAAKEIGDTRFPASSFHRFSLPPGERHRPFPDRVLLWSDGGSTLPWENLTGATWVVLREPGIISRSVDRLLRLVLVFHRVTLWCSLWLVLVFVNVALWLVSCKRGIAICVGL